MGGQNVSCGLGVEIVQEKTSFGGLRKLDSSGLCPFPLRKMTGCEEGGERIIGGCF